MRTADPRDACFLSPLDVYCFWDYNAIYTVDKGLVSSDTIRPLEAQLEIRK